MTQISGTYEEESVTFCGDDSSRISPTLAPKLTNNLNTINHLQACDIESDIAVNVRKFPRATFSRASAVFSTISKAGNEIAPPASRVPNLK